MLRGAAVLACAWLRLPRRPVPGGLPRSGPGLGMVGEADIGARTARGFRADARALRLL